MHYALEKKFQINDDAEIIYLLGNNTFTFVDSRPDALSIALHSGLIEVAKLLLRAHPQHIVEETAESLLRLE
jgi:hypothetical protein